MVSCPMLLLMLLLQSRCVNASNFLQLKKKLLMSQLFMGSLPSPKITADVPDARANCTQYSYL
jgi:hypothetical protein